MQKDVTFVSLTHNQLGYNMTYNLKYYVDSDALPPDIDIDKSVLVKEKVVGMTNDQLVNRGLVDIGEQMQNEIDNFKKVQTALGVVDFAAKEFLLEGALNG